MSSLNTDNKKIKKEIEKFKKSGNIQKAIETCLNAISMDENDAELHIKLGDLYMERHLDIHQIQQYADEAITEYQRALESCVDSAEIYYKIGMAFYYKRELEKALNYFKLALEHNTKMSQALIMLAIIAQHKGNFIEAIEYAKRAVELAPFKSGSAHMLIYELLSITNKKNFIVKYFHLLAATLTMPWDKFASKHLFQSISLFFQLVPITIKIDLMIFFKGFNQDVLNMYREAIDKFPRVVGLYIALGQVYQQLRRYDDAICEYKMAIWLDSLNLKAYDNLCSLYEEQKDFDNAIDICMKILEIQPSSASYHGKLAQYYYLKGEIDLAIEQYQTTVTLNPNSQWTSIVAQTLGFIFQENVKNLDAAISSYQNAHNLNPNDIDIYLNLGNVFFEKGSYDNALTVYKKALELSPHNARLHCNLGYLYWGKGDVEEAVKEYEKAIKYDNTYDIAYNNLGVIYLDDLGMIKKAIELFESARKYNPNYALANYNLARAIALTGDKVEAAKLYQIALDINEYTQELDPLDIQEKIQNLFT
ncbi:MAG: tetratricopeptide repeat protein [Candidatus Gastranaerophilales bacterium]|nr:tetratricopeptide repeat protein [Candidatus Gastranaerophilales bacterium]